uniref:Uncharacterized protein n=1 Tax=Cacopsylla melanoneura TaxID=428564 RepID=A0A8D8YQ45_9HEMI
MKKKKQDQVEKTLIKMKPIRKPYWLTSTSTKMSVLHQRLPPRLKEKQEDRRRLDEVGQKANGKKKQEQVVDTALLKKMPLRKPYWLPSTSTKRSALHQLPQTILKNALQ